jgi:monoamine oxidase
MTVADRKHDDSVPASNSAIQAKSGTTRRSFVSGAAAGALGTVAFGGLGDASGESLRKRTRGAHRPRRVDVAVVGAGPAGLAAATTVAADGKSVLVLEARNRAGGRIKNWSCGMPPACDCGHTILPTHTRVTTLLKEFGIETYQQHCVATGQGNDAFYVEDQRVQGPAGGPLNSETGAFIFTDASVPLRELDAMAATVPPDAPWEAGKASEWDAITTETWKQ